MGFPQTFIDFDFILPYIRFFSILMIPFGILFLLYGYKLFKFFLAFIGFFIGFGIGAGIGALSDQLFITGLLGGILGALVFYALYKIGIFFLGVVIGGLIGLILMAMAEEMQPALLLIFSIGGGIFALYVEKAIIILFSSYQGASIVITGVSWLFFPEYQLRVYSRIFVDFESYLGLASTQMLLSLILTVIGVLYQYGRIPHKADQYLPGSIRKKVKDQAEIDSDSADEKEKVTREKSVTAYEKINNVDSPTSTVSFSNTLASTFSSLGTWINSFARNTERIIGKISDRLFKLFHHTSSSSEMYIQSNSTIPSDRFGSIENYLKFPIQLKIKNDDRTFLVDSVIGVNQGGYHTATFGRAYVDSSHHVQIKDPERHISRFHGEFALKEGVCYVRRLSDINPLWLNGEEVGKDVFKLIKQGDVIQTGNVQMVII